MSPLQNEPHVRVEEVTSVLYPAPGVSIEQVLADAQITGATHIEVFDDRIEVTWFKRESASDG